MRFLLLLLIVVLYSVKVVYKALSDDPNKIFLQEIDLG